MARLTAPLTSAFGLFLTLTAHAAGWPVVESGSSAITDAMVAELERLGGHVVTGQWVRSLAELPPATAVVVDASPKGLAAMAGDALPAGYGRSLGRFRYGPGVCKVDWALSGPVPWTAEVCRRAGTLHLGGTFAEVAASEADVNAGRHPGRPYCIVVQAGVADPTRAPEGQQALWGYCHVPSGSTVDMSAAIEAQIERFAPGFTDLVLARTVRTAAEEEEHNPNYVGGDIAGGASTLIQTLFRPTVALEPVPNPAGRGVPVLGIDRPGGRGARYVRGLRGPHRAPRPLRRAVAVPGVSPVNPDRPRRRSWSLLGDEFSRRLDAVPVEADLVLGQFDALDRELERFQRQERVELGRHGLDLVGLVVAPVQGEGELLLHKGQGVLGRRCRVVDREQSGLHGIGRYEASPSFLRLGGSAQLITGGGDPLITHVVLLARRLLVHLVHCHFHHLRSVVLPSESPATHWHPLDIYLPM